VYLFSFRGRNCPSPWYSPSSEAKNHSYRYEILCLLWRSVPFMKFCVFCENLCLLWKSGHETATYRCEDTRSCVMQFWPPDDEHMCSKYVEAWNKLIVKQKFCATSWLITEINILYMFWGNCVSIIRRTYCIYATLVFFTVYGWLSGVQARQPPISMSHRYSMFSWWRVNSCPKHVQKLK